VVHEVLLDALLLYAGNDEDALGTFHQALELAEQVQQLMQLTEQ
jgi:hypothetical protein